MSASDIRLQPKMTTALEVVTLIRVIPIEAAVDLLEQYARTYAAGIRADDALERMARLERAQ